jgi:hypothetical protein
MSQEIEKSKALTVGTNEQQAIDLISVWAGRDDVDADKIEKLLDIQIKMMDRQAKMDFNQALCRVQSGMPRITQRGTIKTKDGKVTSKYMLYEDIDTVIRPRLEAEGFSLMHTREDVNGKMVVTTALKHLSGHQESVAIPLPYDQPNALKNAVQAAVSTFSYGKRVNVCSLLNLVAEGEDDDGQKSQANTIDEGQAAEIKSWLERLFNQGLQVDMQKFLAYLGAPSVDDISASKYETAITLLRRKETNNG